MSIILIGFMGAGKSTIGKHLSIKMGLPFIDLDEEIVKKYNKSIPQIFEKYGEQYFREIEHTTLKDLINRNIIIATGGGIIENPNNLDLFSQNKFNIWIDANIQTMYNRIVGDSNRPNANNKTFEEIKKLYNCRFSRYNEIAYIKVNSENEISQSVQSIYNLILTDDGN